MSSHFLIRWFETFKQSLVIEESFLIADICQVLAQSKVVAHREWAILTVDSLAQTADGTAILNITIFFVLIDNVDYEWQRGLAWVIKAVPHLL